MFLLERRKEGYKQVKGELQQAAMFAH